tara:strand:- start:52 stop:192 length:141 start_codon:yes stop_codon:yes gene_type:complete
MGSELKYYFFSLEVLGNLVILREKLLKPSLWMGIIEMSTLNYTELG